MASVSISGSLICEGRPAVGMFEEWMAFHQSSVRTYNETRKESRSMCQHRLLVEVRCQHKVSAPSPLLGITHQPSKKGACVSFKMRSAARVAPLRSATP